MVVYEPESSFLSDAEFAGLDLGLSSLELLQFLLFLPFFFFFLMVMYFILHSCGEQYKESFLAYNIKSYMILFNLT